MNHSLYIHGESITALYQKLTEQLADKVYLRTAYLKATRGRYSSIEDVTLRVIEDHLDFIARQTENIELGYILFDIMSHLVRARVLTVDNLNQIIDPIMNRRNLEPVRKLYALDNGSWKVGWPIDEERSLDLSVLRYDPDAGEIVPESIIEVMHSALQCLSLGSNISGLSLFLIALETTLWDHLTLKGVSKKQIFETYPNKVTLHLAWDGSNYNTTITDHLGTRKIPPATGYVNCDIYYTSKTKSGGKRILEMIIDDGNAEWFSNSDDVQTEEREATGMRTAIQRARKEGLLNDFWEKSFDETFRILRNHLVHQSVDFQNIVIQTLYGELKLGHVSHNRQLTMFFIQKIIRYVSDAYYDIALSKLG